GAGVGQERHALARGDAERIVALRTAAPRALHLGAVHDLLARVALDPQPLGEVERAGRVCPKCHYPFRVSARERVALLADPGTFEERDSHLESTDPLGFKDTKKYRDRIRAAVQKAKTDEAVITGVARIGGLPAVLCVFEFGFLGGSMGSVVGEKLTRAIELAIDKHLPVVIVS